MPEAVELSVRKAAPARVPRTAAKAAQVRQAAAKTEEAKAAQQVAAQQVTAQQVTVPLAAACQQRLERPAHQQLPARQGLQPQQVLPAPVRRAWERRAAAARGRQEMLPGPTEQAARMQLGQERAAQRVPTQRVLTESGQMEPEAQAARGQAAQAVVGPVAAPAAQVAEPLARRAARAGLGPVEREAAEAVQVAEANPLMPKG